MTFALGTLLAPMSGPTATLASACGRSDSVEGVRQPFANEGDEESMLLVPAVDERTDVTIPVQDPSREGNGVVSLLVDLSHGVPSNGAIPRCQLHRARARAGRRWRPGRVVPGESYGEEATLAGGTTHQIGPVFEYGITPTSAT
jgi:hypothetical protein